MAQAWYFTLILIGASLHCMQPEAPFLSPEFVAQLNAYREQQRMRCTSFVSATPSHTPLCEVTPAQVVPADLPSNSAQLIEQQDRNYAEALAQDKARTSLLGKRSHDALHKCEMPYRLMSADGTIVNIRPEATHLLPAARNDHSMNDQCTVNCLQLSGISGSELQAIASVINKCPDVDNIYQLVVDYLGHYNSTFIAKLVRMAYFVDDTIKQAFIRLYISKMVHNESRRVTVATIASTLHMDDDEVQKEYDFMRAQKMLQPFRNTKKK